MRKYTLALTSIALAAIALTGCSTPSFVVHISNGAVGEPNVHINKATQYSQEAVTSNATAVKQKQEGSNNPESSKEDAKTQHTQPTPADTSLAGNKTLLAARSEDSKSTSALKTNPPEAKSKQLALPAKPKDKSSMAMTQGNPNSAKKMDLEKSSINTKLKAKEKTERSVAEKLVKKSTNDSLKENSMSSKKLSEPNGTGKAKASSKKILKNDVTEKANIKNVKKLESKKAKYKKPYFNAIAGSLRDNIQRFASQYNYQLIWNMYDPSTGFLIDYNWVGNKKMEDKNPLNMLHKMIDPYNVETKVWKENHVICITNNNSCNK